MNLSDMLETPSQKTFRFRILPGNDWEVIPESEDDAGDFELVVKYMPSRDYQEMLERAIRRFASTKGGRKKIAVAQDEARKELCKMVLMGWRMTLRAAYTLRFPVSLSGKKPDTPIEFTDENVRAMADHSDLAAVVHDLVNTHGNWFDGDEDYTGDVTEDSLGNSGSGQSGSSAEPRAQTA